MPGNSVVTNFTQYSVAQLNQMLDQSNPASCVSAAQTWDSTGKLLHEQAHSLKAQLRSLGPAWSGTAATDYNRMMTDLVGGITKVADIAFQMRNLTDDAVDALNTARAEMPAPVDVPAISPVTLALATTPAQIGLNLSPQAAAQLQQQQAAAVQAVAHQQQAAAAASAAQAKAIAVMQALAGSYVAAQAAIPPSPDAAAPAVPAGSASPATPALTGTSAPITLTAAPLVLSGAQAATPPGQGGGQSSPLFGDMYTVGLAAAAAAVAGGVGSLVTSASSASKNASGAGSPQLGARTAAAGGAAARIAAGGVGGVAVGNAAAGNAAVTPAGDVSGAGANLAAGSPIGPAAGSTTSSEPMMPMMPMGGMAGGGLDGGGSRRIPPWLVEHQDVWGTSIPAAPGLVGD